MTDVKQKKENVKMHLKDLRQNLKKNAFSSYRRINITEAR